MISSSQSAPSGLFSRFFSNPSASGIVLIAAAALAIVLANSPWAGGYHALFHAELPLSPIPKLSTLHLWINDGLMAVFFFVVGLEVKRELLNGNLATPAARRLPVLAAAAGMAGPAIIYLAIAQGAPELHSGWAIPAATDIAFAMGVIGLLGRRVPPALRLFLLTVAIVDDIGAVLVIAFFYTANISFIWLLPALLCFAALMVLNRKGVDVLWPFILGAVLLWVCVLHSGIHATVAGVVAALTIPVRTPSGRTLLDNAEHSLAPWNSFAVVPLFGFANAGVALGAMGLSALLDPLPLAVAGGLVFGKQIGIFGAIALANAIGFAPKPANCSWLQIWGTAVLCGIGFTMSLFIGALAFPQAPHLIEEAKMGVLAGSVVSAILGYTLLRLGAAKPAA